MPYIDCTVIKGQNKAHRCVIEALDELKEFQPLDLNDYAVQFRVMGAPTANAKVLVEHIITQNTDLETEGQITNPENGEFVFIISAEDTEILGLGSHPIQLNLLDADSLEIATNLTEGNTKAEFNRINIVQV